LPVRPATVDVDNDLAYLAFTSGTEGLPKAAMFTHAGNAASIYQRLTSSGFGPRSVLLFFGPSWITLRWSFAAGATAVEASGLDAMERLALCQELGVTDILARPHALAEMVRVLELFPTELKELQRLESSGSRVPPELARRVEPLFGVPVRSVYNLTEMFGAANRPRADDVRPGSVGPPVSDTQERIVDPDSLEDLPAGELGEILVRGPQMMKGYRYAAPETELVLLPGGWLRTGDIGRFDADGNLYLVDRSKEMIKTLGRQVSPAEVESVLLEHPAVKEVAVVPVFSRHDGEFPKAFVVREPGKAVTSEELLTRVASLLAPFKVPREVAFVDELPKEARGKVLRRLLTDRDREETPRDR
jgi:acyl-CoA synthetase (AMP-forming)/AMP-acid ligase II